MESDGLNLQDAVGVLRRYHGAQLRGPLKRTEAEMRDTLTQQMGLDEVSADGVLERLRDAGRLEYVGSQEAGTEPGTSSTGPVISMPNTQSADGGRPLITTASPAMIMGIANDQPPDPDRVEEAPGPVTIGERAEIEGDNTEGYWRIG